MAVSVRLEPMLEKELELTAKRLGVTKSQFIVSALERALGRKNPYELLLQVKAQGAMVSEPENTQGYQGDLSDSDAMRTYISEKLSKKHGFGAA
jgi:metal-responsive CopG/Arc/MetJ family transcriptional regulator